MVININQTERLALLNATKPSNLYRIYNNLFELDKIGFSDKDLGKAKSKNNYVDMTDICDKREDIRCSVIRNQFSSLILLESLSVLKSTDNVNFVFKVEDILIATLIDCISIRMLQLQKSKEDTTKNELYILKNILTKIEAELDIIELYQINKKKQNNIDIMLYKEICIRLIGGKTKDA